MTSYHRIQQYVQAITGDRYCYRIKDFIRRFEDEIWTILFISINTGRKGKRLKAKLAHKDIKRGETRASLVAIHVVTLIESGVMEDQHVTFSQLQADMFVKNWNEYKNDNDEIDVVYQVYRKELFADE